MRSDWSFSRYESGRITGIGCLLIFPRSSRVSSHSVAFSKRNWDTLLLVGCARRDRRTPQLSDSLNYCGILLNAVGMAG